MLVEVVIALSAVRGRSATSLISLLTLGHRSDGLARHRTVAQQAALSQIEAIRDDGLHGRSGSSTATRGAAWGSPRRPPPARTARTRPSRRASTTAGCSRLSRPHVSYVNDPGPLSYTSYANYKKVVVTVTRTSDSSLLANAVTYVAPPVQGVRSRTRSVKASVVDYGNSTAGRERAGRARDRPERTRERHTDASGGDRTSPASRPNPTSGGQAYYDLSLTPPTGYVTLYDTVSPAAPAHVQLAPGQTWPTALYVYKPATIYVQLKNFDGTHLHRERHDRHAHLHAQLARDVPTQNFSYPGSAAHVTSMTEGTRHSPADPGALLHRSPFWAGTSTQTPPTSGTRPRRTCPTRTRSTLTHTFTFTNAQLATVTATVKRGTTLLQQRDRDRHRRPVGRGAVEPVTVGDDTSTAWRRFANVPVGSGYTIRATRT